MLIRTSCQHCQNEFESEGENRTEFCPHCGKESAVVQPIRKSNNMPVSDGKIEIALEIIGAVILISGLVSAGICVCILLIGNAGVNSTSEDDNIYLITAIVIGISQGIIVRVLFKAVAEIIRLLRQIAAKS